MSWMKDLQLRDIDQVEQVEVTCKKCGRYRPETPQDLMIIFSPNLYLDEVEKRLKCKSWGCGGSVRLAISTVDKLEGFLGGMA